MSPKHFFFTPESQRGTSNLTSEGAYITVTPNLPSNPDCQDLFLGISMDLSCASAGEAWAVVDADELRDAIDKAVGPRREPAPHEGHKPYRPLDRDRLLRHIEDVEASLTRRNERHEQDQARIRELVARVEELEAQSAAESRPLTPDAITDEMIDRVQQWVARVSTGSTVYLGTKLAVHEMLTAALTEPPARPEGAERLERLLTEDLGDFRPPVTAEAIADLLASRGVRAPEDGAA